LATVVTGLFTWGAIELRSVSMIETGILLFTTSLTVLGVNLALDLTVKSHSNSWIFASAPKTKGVDRKEICEYMLSLLSGDSLTSKLVSNV